MLVELLAKHVQVLTLQVARVAMPLDMPCLQHLLLDLNIVPASVGWRYHDTLFPAISHLKGLKTLYIRSVRKGVYLGDSSSDVIPRRSLQQCVHLRHVVLQYIRLACTAGLSVPAGCSLQVICMPSHMTDSTWGGRHRITGLILRRSSPLRPDFVMC